MKEEKDLRASLYQQFVNLELPVGSNLEIDIDEAKKNKNKLARVRVRTSKGVLFSMSFCPYEYDSIVDAKQKLESKLRLWSEFEHLQSAEARESFVDSIISKRYLH